MSSGKVSLSFGDYVKVVELINPKTSLGQVNRIISMNSHGRRFQDNIGMEELKGVHKANVKVSWGPGK